MLPLQWGVGGGGGGRGTQQASQLVFVGLRGHVMKEQIKYPGKLSALVFMSKASINNNHHHHHHHHQIYIALII